MDLSPFINRIVTEVVRLVTADPLAWLGGGAREDLAALAANPAVRETTDVAQIAALFLIAIFAVIIGFTTVWRKALLTPQPAEATVGDRQTAGAAVAAPGPLRGRWEAVVSHLDSARESDWKVAVIDADKFVDDALARAGFSGDTFGDRLMNIEPGALKTLDGIWWAHKIRNRLAHETDYFLRYTEAKQAVSYYAQALEELHLI